MPPETEAEERARTRHALERLDRWGRDPSSDGGENIAILDEVPDGRGRAEAALRNPNAGDVLVSAAAGWEFVDLAGRADLGGGSHGSLEAADSEVPMLAVGLPDPPASITEIKSTVLEHFGLFASAPTGKDERA